MQKDQGLLEQQAQQLGQEQILEQYLLVDDYLVVQELHHEAGKGNLHWVGIQDTAERGAAEDIHQEQEDNLGAAHAHHEEDILDVVAEEDTHVVVLLVLLVGMAGAGAAVQGIVVGNRDVAAVVGNRKEQQEDSLLGADFESEGDIVGDLRKEQQAEHQLDENEQHLREEHQMG
mmetsp:Transcript_119550/g.235006  ORF Transcript_119550/g.235006 Transcript_119550/m.235006 type:complete len:174 (-) Transcript_119550:1366-1887(-)